MKSMTFGTVPEFGEFEAAFREVMGREEVYDLSMPHGNTDYRNMDAAGLLTIMPAEWLIAAGAPNEPRMATQMTDINGCLICGYTAAQLYRLIENLTEMYYFDDDNEFADWAGAFASSILSTLGFEWV